MLTNGSRLGPYEIISALGAGGMGEVYRATDTNLGRQVAIKILPEAFAQDVDRLARFEREARLLATLNHPNIAQIYGVEKTDGVRALVMELVEGPTLADRIAQGPIRLDEALPIAKQIAEALEAAHEQGIIHRDLKPANIKLRPDGQVKVLDFGLAKALEPTGAMSPNVTQSPTITLPAMMTGAGMILGTAAYMSPEQARGKPVDKRSDIWAFGCVLYEMLTGIRAFEGEDVGDTLAAIVRGEPNWTKFPPDVPAHIRSTVRRCLEKDRNARIPHISIATFLMDEAIGAAALSTTAVLKGTGASTMLWKAAIALLLLTTVIGFAVAYASRGGTPVVAQFMVSPPENGVFVTGGRIGASGIISPDGRTLAFTTQDVAGRVLLWVRQIDSLTAQPLVGTDGAAFPFWSPDSRFIAYFAQDKLFKIAAGGGPPQTVCIAPDGRGGTWSRDGVIVFGSIAGTLSRVSSAGGEPVAVTRLGEGQQDHRFPSFLPDALHLLFYVNAGGGSGTDGIYVTSLESDEPRLLITAESGGIYASSGHLLFVRQGTLFGQSFDPKTFELAGDHFLVAERVASSVFGGVLAFSVSDNGMLAYGVGPGNVEEGLQMVWLDRQGKPIETIGPRGNYRGLDLAPDGRRVAAHRHDGEGGDVWVLDGPRGTTSRLTFDASQENSSPVWSPDGTHIAFASFRSGKWGLYQKSSDGTGNDELLIQADSTVAPLSWSQDGRSIVYFLGNQGKQDLWVLALTDDRKAVPFLNAPFAERHAQISPDGKWLAYVSDDTGRNEVYVRPFPMGNGKWQVSDAGGSAPRWRHDGRELFYLAVSPKVMAVEINVSGSVFEPGAPKELFDAEIVNDPHPSGPFYRYAVSANGQQFLFARPTSSGGDPLGPAPIAVVVNWEGALKQ